MILAVTHLEVTPVFYSVCDAGFLDSSSGSSSSSSSSLSSSSVQILPHPGFPPTPTNLPAWVPYQLACLGALPTCLPPTCLPAGCPIPTCLPGCPIPTCLPGCPIPTCLLGCPTNLPASNLPAWVPYPGCPTNLPAWVPHQLACLGAPPTCLPG